MQKVIIIGATSGIGRGLAELYSNSNCMVGIIGRREYLLKELHSQNPDRYHYRADDVSKPSIIGSLNSLYEELNGLDLLVISAGAGELNTKLEYNLELPAININVIGFTNIAGWAYKIFEKQKSGHLVAISSIAGIRGNGIAPTYNASKAYQMNYLEGLRQKSAKQNLAIYITDIRPGFVDTAMVKGEGLFWVFPVNKAVKQIYSAIKKKRKIAYISKRWKFIAVILRMIPSSVYCKM